MRVRWSRGVLAASTTLLLAVLGACSSGGTSSDGPSPTSSTSPSASATTSSPDRDAYVALGDSFTAGPGIDPQSTDAGLCQRSNANWPALVATTLDRDLTDVSCTGATTTDLAATVASGAVPRDTGLVTVSAGGNDGSLFVALIRACATGSSTCRAYVSDELPGVLDQTTADLADLLGSVRGDAPDADVVLVGYPRIMPTTGTCPEVRIPAADVSSVVTAEAALDAALASAADRAGVRYVSLRTASEGHDACAGDAAWTNGTSPTPGDGIVFHPNARGMQAVADVVAAAVR
ncbi:SGNH/GDSL hydrolase family protein [Aeromicrobium fastidiosum]|uniref:SGNH/GDSL hydrolase family protein n=1 Tax=Aeromicrobium fastidiosum TaxID=52699 RepID=A0A641ANJ4_9ACTN|nr:SGNH/GDSL hydrolase family protein [Aeromicrobium fastidiosum]KAA1376494.1 SGNH/GDSL hydrolase family protein [Aeromicrobium fastidiosum]MBP2391588.1 lysophospholipase L1-like esterase [Aeromicrobium fastidiosum]